MLCGLALFGGKFINPRLTVWHQQKHQFQLKSDGGLTVIEKTELEANVVHNAERKFTIWHGVSQIVNLAMMILLIWRFWHLTQLNRQGSLITFGQQKRNLLAK